MNYDPGSYIEVEGTRNDLLQFHFHAPSENAVEGKRYPLEMHLVHRNEAGELAVVAVFLDAGAKNEALEPIWENMPAEEGRKEVDAEVKAIELLPSVQTTYRFAGSLTTPPCTEGVRWFVMTTPIELSQEQIAAFERIYRGNSRPLQPLNGRRVTVDTTP